MRAPGGNAGRLDTNGGREGREEGSPSLGQPAQEKRHTASGGITAGEAAVAVAVVDDGAVAGPAGIWPA